ncbi:TPA: NUDIX domain-containing protein [Candidatus Woesearchaeota archaeon]|nr:NUDIX domain-containing protein [Candidatus Woesearchaeota archaeon]HII69134.1 NUDIX domain-containing protein [Candidatus Woesearchaeota archaeon]
MQPIRKAGALILRDRQILLVRPKGKLKLITPGGKYEEGEDAQACLMRELKEELSVRFLSFKPFKSYHFPKAEFSAQGLFLELYIVKIAGKPRASGEIEDIVWVGRKGYEMEKKRFSSSFQTIIPDLVRQGLL